MKQNNLETKLRYEAAFFVFLLVYCVLHLENVSFVTNGTDK